MDLGDDFIPKQDRKALLRKLSRLSLTVLCHLVKQWGERYGSANGMTSNDLAHAMTIYLKRKSNRKAIVKRILLEFWPQGLSLYQLAQVDSYTLVERPGVLLWTCSTAIDCDGSKKVLNMDPDNFVYNLKEDLHRLYLSHIYIFKHPKLPSIVCRIQLFESQNLVENKCDRNYLISRSPYYVVFLINSPNIIHSFDNDSYAQLVLQCVQRTISRKDPIILRANNGPPVKSLESLHILKGVSRYANSLGPWSKYADADFDISPFGSTGDHFSIRGKEVFTGINDEDESEHRKHRLENIMLRFKGSKKGVAVQKAYESEHLNSRVHHLQKGSSKTNDMNDMNTPVSKYTSLIPVSKVDFLEKQDLGYEQGQISLRFKFLGNDVFGGLHELCDRGNLDIDKVPGWLTGENGLDSGTIVNGEFIKETKKGGLI